MIHKKDEIRSEFPYAIGAPARRALEGAGYPKLEEIAKLSEAEMLKLHGMGPKALGKLRQALNEKELSFANNASE